MSLRARLLVGMGFVAVVLVVVAFVVPRITRTYLVDQVDGQLATPRGRCGRTRMDSAASRTTCDRRT